MSRMVICTASALVIRSVPEASEGFDTGRRMIRDQRSRSYGLSYDEKWVYVDAPAGRGWVSCAHVKDDTKSEGPTAAWPKVPRGREEIEAVFGKAGAPTCSAGRVQLLDILHPSWAPGQVINTFACHKLMEDVFNSVFTEIFVRNFWYMLEDFGGCYAVRKVKSSTKPSTHSWGISVDLNVKTNQLGAPPTMNQKIISIFGDHGFEWGGGWSRPDGMHFQYARGF